MPKLKATSYSCGQNRRGFLKSAGLVSLAFAGLPQIVSAITGDEHHAKEIIKSQTIKNGKAKHISLLHTADIHA
ncbi:MAG: hypothetical protein KKE39_07685 [Bacteroidetes bacterium]|nr:hypothetical protein [Bacteroidota bacterium]MBU1371969.1 hypothetical protein [Bacteroidota bacterium]MBU1483571.1 hypothetical protein [Bacteroidota bacterium]MBU1762095.1 hypothetical protein [Bacteroidota bacterium]MBU2267974.1 hypothetical protein [Bacteroidota bacterium]